MCTHPIPPALDAGRLKHLEMLQAVITRMANNSFLIKGWSTTLLAAILVLAVKDGHPRMALVACLPTLMFWLLDAYFLHQERLFRKLWDRLRSEARDSASDFSFDTSTFIATTDTWLQTARSRTLLLFHGGQFVLLVIVGIAIR